MSDGPYRLGDEIGRGALGRVVRVSGGSSTVFAGKILHASHRGDMRASIRFTSEAETLATVQHENIVRVYGIDTIDGEMVMRMELVDGPDLSKLLAIEGPLESERLVNVALGIVAGLRAAHLAGLVHRDLKPQNILLTTDGVPKIADFGMARAASFAGVDESAFAVAGTPDYMAPECVDPLAVDARSDLYSLGCILFELAMGHPPFSAATSFAVLEAHRNSEIPLVECELPSALKALINSLLAKSPADRPQSAAAVERILGEVREGKETALAVLEANTLAISGQCISCGRSLLDAISVCFACGLKRVTLEAGQHSLFVVGPGEIGDKLDAQLRQELLKWLRTNPSLGLGTESLETKVPRVPFVVVTKTSESSARSLANAIESLGLECTVQRGGAYRLPAIRKKGWLLSGRLLAIGAASCAGLYSSLGVLIVPSLGAGVLAGIASGWVLAGKRVTSKSKRASVKLPAAVATSLLGVSPVVQGMRLQRHRESLRGVVERVIVLCEKLPADTLAECELDLARLVDIALVGSARMDEIEVAIVDADMRNPSPETLTEMRERDRLAGQLLEVTAFLDSLRARTAAAKLAGADTANTDEQLDDLRAHISALEEVQSL